MWKIYRLTFSFILPSYFFTTTLRRKVLHQSCLVWGALNKKKAHKLKSFITTFLLFREMKHLLTYSIFFNSLKAKSHLTPIIHFYLRYGRFYAHINISALTALKSLVAMGDECVDESIWFSIFCWYDRCMLVKAKRGNYFVFLKKKRVGFVF